MALRSEEPPFSLKGNNFMTHHFPPKYQSKPHFFPTINRNYYAPAAWNSLHLPQIMPQPQKRFDLKKEATAAISGCTS